MNTDVELREYIRGEWRNDASWVKTAERSIVRTRFGLLDLVTFLIRNRYSRQAPCC